MTNNYTQSTFKLAVAITVSIAAMATPQPASAQNLTDAVLNLATSSLNTIFQRRPRQTPNRNVGVFNSNLTGNNLNICILPSCRIPVTSVRPTVVPQTRVSSTTVVNRSGTLVPNPSVQFSPSRSTLVSPLNLSR